MGVNYKTKYILERLLSTSENLNIVLKSKLSGESWSERTALTRYFVLFRLKISVDEVNSKKLYEI